MGIQGLLSFLDKASRPAKISEFSGCTVAIDSYCWLHKGAFSCAEKLARGEKTDQYVKYCLKFVNMLLSYNIKPIMVFDGRHLPAKAETEKKRRELRENNRKKAAELLRLERESEARSLIQRCVDVTHEMALALMKECRSLGVDCIVAPFEADAQLAYLNLNGFAHLIITEDSDLLLFGCKRVMFKMDMFGNGVLVEQNKLPLCMKMHPNQFTMEKFRHMCILSGCDYLKSLPGIGLAKALKFIKKTQDNDISRALSRLGSYLNMPNLEVPIDYIEKFVSADLMFKYQPVFEPRSRRVVPMSPLPPGSPEPLSGHHLSPEVAFQLALGNLNPFSLERVDSWDPDQPQTLRTSSWKSPAQRGKSSIWSKDYQPPRPLPPPRDPREVEYTSTRGKSRTQPVSVLTDKISALPSKRNIEDELSRLREAYSLVKPPPAKRLCQEGEVEGLGVTGASSSLPSGVNTTTGASSPLHCSAATGASTALPSAATGATTGLDSGLGTESSSSSEELVQSEEVTKVLPTPLQATPPRKRRTASPRKKSREEQTDRGTEPTVDDLLGEIGSPVLVRGSWRNPFRAHPPPSGGGATTPGGGGGGVNNSVRQVLGGALDRFSKLKKTQVEAACIVQSRYFSSGSTPPVKNPTPKKKPETTDLNESLLEIINSTPSPKKRPSLLETKRTVTPRKNIFEVLDMEENSEKTESPIKLNTPERVGSPRKNVFAVTTSTPEAGGFSTPEKSFRMTALEEQKVQEVEEMTPVVSPKRQSFLQILDEVSKEIEEKEKKCQSEGSDNKPDRGRHTSSFKWSQPLLGDPKKKFGGGPRKSLIGLYQPKTKLTALPFKSPKMGLKKGTSSSCSPRVKPSLPANANFKQLPPPPGGQATLLNMFAFQPKPKLK